ncbi:hypothetical protein EV207_101144 [Scopulibacillus darangshiensis]|uniref:Uncharacterized protein n=1 Tax=Scopulibacillus darangshiensis TaxID=442528 RepID=A0A4V6NQR6_9BACL|nr:hypothetical protein EV207_101144 [Scopulibacillus darangshiensis]
MEAGRECPICCGCGWVEDFPEIVECLECDGTGAINPDLLEGGGCGE